MDSVTQLRNIELVVAAILQRFKQTRDGIWIADGDQGAFIGLMLEARDLFNEALGPANGFSLSLAASSGNGRVNYAGSQSFASVEECLGIIRSGIRTIERKAASPLTVNGAPGSPMPVYVSLSRIEELRAIREGRFDFRRVVRICEELNVAFAAQSYISVAALLRALKDHVPPALGAKTFVEYSENVVARSHKGSMATLATSLMHIADEWLHGQIRSKETLPMAQQVDFRQDLDVLLGELVRLNR